MPSPLRPEPTNPNNLTGIMIGLFMPIDVVIGLFMPVSEGSGVAVAQWAVMS